MVQVTVVVLVAAALVIALGVALVLVGARNGSAGTRGERIRRADRAATALLVVDVQEDFTRRSRRFGFGEEVLEPFFAALNGMQSVARAEGAPVVHMRNVFDGALARLFSRLVVEGRGIAGRLGTRLDPRVERTPGDEDLVKTKGDAFSNAKLDAVLRDARVGHVVIAGLDGVACVTATARGALQRGYRVTLLEDCILTARPARWATLRRSLEHAGAEVRTSGDVARALAARPRA